MLLQELVPKTSSAFDNLRINIIKSNRNSLVSSGIHFYLTYSAIETLHFEKLNCKGEIFERACIDLKLNC